VNGKSVSGLIDEVAQHSSLLFCEGKLGVYGVFGVD
jgi:hypothetical protein